MFVKCIKCYCLLLLGTMTAYVRNFGRVRIMRNIDIIDQIVLMIFRLLKIHPSHNLALNAILLLSECKIAYLECTLMTSGDTSEGSYIILSQTFIDHVLVKINAVF